MKKKIGIFLALGLLFITCLETVSAANVSRLDNTDFTVSKNPLAIVDYGNANAPEATISKDGNEAIVIGNSQDPNHQNHQIVTIPESAVNSNGTSFTVTYSKVGTYNGKEIGAKVTYTVYEYVEGSSQVLGVNYAGPGYVQAIVPNNFYSGIMMAYSKYNKYTYDFFYTDTKESVDVKDAIFTFNSLDYDEGVSAIFGPTIDETVYFEQNMADKISDIYLLNGTSNIEVVSDASSPKLKGKYSLALSPISEDGFVDKIGNANYTRNSASIKYSGKLEFFIGNSQSLTASLNDGAVFMSPSSAPITGSTPPNPEKYVITKDNKRAKTAEYEAGSSLTFEVDQKVNTLGVDILTRYSSFSMVDELPKEVDYVSAKLYDESGNEVTDGTITYDENAHKVTWTANNTFLSSMPLKGETYTLKINVKLNSKMESTQ